MDQPDLAVYHYLLSWKHNMGSLPEKCMRNYIHIKKCRFHFLENCSFVVTSILGGPNKQVIATIKWRLSNLCFLYSLLIILYTILVPSGGCTMDNFRPGFITKVNEDAEIGTPVITFDAAPVDNIYLDIKADQTSKNILPELDMNVFNVTLDLNISRYAVIVIQPLTHLLPNFSLLEVTINCQGPGLSPRSTKLLKIGISDVNNMVPHFVHAPYKASVNELSPVGFLVLQDIEVEDADMPDQPNSQFGVTIIDGDPDNTFRIEATKTGASLFLNKPLDYEKRSEDYNITLSVKDYGMPPLSSTTYVLVSVEDGDDQAPVFTQTLYKGNINNLSGTDLILEPPIQAYDQDKGLNEVLLYAVATGANFFSIDDKTGQLKLSHQLSLEEMATGPWTLTIEAFQINDPKKKAVAAVIINVPQKNVPIFVESVHQRMLPENPKVGEIIAQIMGLIREKSTTSALKYSILAGNEKDLFTIDPNTGDIIISHIDTDSLFTNNGDKAAFQLAVMAQETSSPFKNGTIVVQLFVPSQELPTDTVQVAGVASWVIILIICLGILLLLVVVILAIVCYKCNKVKNKIAPNDSTMNGCAVNGSRFALKSPSPISMDSIGLGNNVDGGTPTTPPIPTDPYRIYYVRVDYLRREAQRPENFEDMTMEELHQEKGDVRQVLLWYQREHGKPVTKVEREMMRPLYDRYRNLKKLLMRSH